MLLQKMMFYRTDLDELDERCHAITQQATNKWQTYAKSSKQVAIGNILR